MDIEGVDRLTPFKTEMPKSRENSRFWAGSDYTRHPNRRKKQKEKAKAEEISDFSPKTQENVVQ
ncbi:MAG: hypothetical protein E7538_10190 [Ruminococcaceae bacterium]|nr:hypothetical protein [Oscillospiraceae bacterium]